ncbi:MAG: DUF4093 domain-containing protein [Clostridia bacterium]|nr:DUF4093 domain-containing protein [Clostridia bacterium]
MIKLSPVLVVEGKYDKAKLARIFDTEIIEVSGFGLFKDEKMTALLRKTALNRGIVVLTDPDGAGLLIRNRIKSCIKEGKVYHAYVPDIKGKESRKTKPSKEGLLGVEGVPDGLIIEAVKNSGAMEDRREKTEKLTKRDMYDLGLSGKSESKARRKELLKELSLPENLSANALLSALNASLTDEEIKKLRGD